HTRFSRDWSSDVCSSDLVPNGDMNATLLGTILYWGKSGESGVLSSYGGGLNLRGGFGLRVQNDGIFGGGDLYVTPLDQAIEGLRSEERRVGKECRSRWTY